MVSESIKTAAVAITAIAAIYSAAWVVRDMRMKRSGFAVSAEAIELRQKALPLMQQTNGHPSFDEWKKNVQPGTPDVVQYADLKGLWAKGGAANFTPQNVQRVM